MYSNNNSSTSADTPELCCFLKQKISPSRFIFHALIYFVRMKGGRVADCRTKPFTLWNIHHKYFCVRSVRWTLAGMDEKVALYPLVALMGTNRHCLRVMACGLGGRMVTLNRSVDIHTLKHHNEIWSPPLLCERRKTLLDCADTLTELPPRGNFNLVLIQKPTQAVIYFFVVFSVSFRSL